MPSILTNNNIELHIDHPLEGYNFSRFDWTGKIVKVLFKDIPLSTIERRDAQNSHRFGKGFYNEFGLERAVGFDETEIGDWFHKIGVGLLKKEDDDYLFSRTYKIKPANFEVIVEKRQVTVHCIPNCVNGYAYKYSKIISLLDNGFTINYNLKNTGEKDIVTSEYNHNFVCLADEKIDKDHVLKLPFKLDSDQFTASVNPEKTVEISQNKINLNGTPKNPFFYSHLNGSKTVKAQWELHHLKHNIGISETGSFPTNKVNLWGWSHVISPELFFDINLKAGKTLKWSRRYTIFPFNHNHI